MFVTIEDTTYKPYDVLQLSDGFAQLLGEYGTIYLASSPEAAGREVERMVRGLLAENPLRFAYNYGLRPVLRWAENQPASFGRKKYNNLAEWLEGLTSKPQEFWDSDGRVRRLDHVDEDILAIIDFEPTVVYLDEIICQ